MSTPQRSLQLPDLTNAKKGTALGALSRRQEALERRIAGHPYRRIARELGVSLNTAYKDVQRALGDLPAHLEQRTEHVRKIELARLDVVATSLWPKVLAGESSACAVYLKVAERRARLLGLDAPIRLEADVQAARPLMHLTDEELLKSFEDMRARKPKIVGQASTSPSYE